MLTTIDTNNVIELGTSCFQFCIRLTNLNLRSVEIIGSYSLASIQLLQEIELPKNLREIQSYAFAKSSIVTVTGEVPITFLTFSECTSLTKVIFPINLESIEEECFLNCVSLESLDFSNSSDNFSISENR